MSHVKLNQQLLEDIKREAKRRKRESPSLPYGKLLNVLSSEYGYATFSSLKQRVKELEQQARDEEIAEEERRWQKRFEEPMVWGDIEDNDPNVFNETFALPILGDHVPWPKCFLGSRLFTGGEGPRRQFEGPINIYDDSPEMNFHGEELRISTDHTILLTLISVAGKHPCGRLVEFSTDDLDKAGGVPLPNWGIPVQYNEIARTLWRLTHSKLVISDFKFKGPILSYADARQHPKRFAILFNPKFINLFYPILSIFD